MTSEGSGGTTERAKAALNGGESSGPAGPVSGAAQAARDVADQASQVATEISNRLPAAAATTAATTRDMMGVAQRQIESSSDEVLTAGTMLSLGVALGLLLAGASRLLVAVAMIPAAAMGATLLDRRNAGRTK